jgi:hypothetical protein
MATPLNPQEIYLLERYTSLEYFGVMRDNWALMIKHLEACLDEFMQNLPLDYRNRPLPEQPDAVWGERVLPNFRDSFQSLCTGYIKLSHGDVDGLNYCHGPNNGQRGETEFWSGWMKRSDENIYGELLNLASRNASNIAQTEGAYWEPGLLTTRYHESFGPLNPPANWPSYRLVPGVQVATGARLAQSGIYLPSLDNSGAQFLSTYYDEAPEAKVFTGMQDHFDPNTGIKDGQDPVYETRPCIWTLVERISDQGGISSNPSLLAAKSHRVPAGLACPEPGFYFTPAKADSRRHFTQGEPMPDFDAQYGMTIWQWDTRQD